MNFNLSKIPMRTTQPRRAGITMISDKGLSIAETQNLLSIASPYIDIVKFAFGTAMVTSLLSEKIKLFKSHNIPVYFGGLLLEAFIVRNQFDDYIKMLNEYEISFIEISDGNLDISHKKKCYLIRTFSKMGTVISEIGSKDKDKVLVTPPYKWIELIKAELDAGSDYIIAEAKESGNEGLYCDSGEVREGLVQELLTKIPGVAWVPDMMLKEDSLRFVQELMLCKNANTNLVRIWGGGVAPPDPFFEITDRLGLLVWEDFWITGDTHGEFKGSKSYPYQGSIYVNNVISTIYRLRNHPSLLLWTDSNEGHAEKSCMMQ